MKRILLAISALLALQVSAIAQVMTVIKPNQANTFNSVISAPYAAVNSSPNPINLVAAFWSGNGTTGAWRSFFKMDLSTISNSATIDSAYFTLYADDNSAWGNPGAPNAGNDNAAYICRLTSPFTSNTINWGNQPTFTTANAAELVQSTASLQDYLKVDATQLIKDILMSGNNHGFAFLLKNEMTTYDSQIFHSSASANESKRPSLTIYYRFPAGVDEVAANELPMSHLLQNGLLTLNTPKAVNGQAGIYSIDGKLLQSAALKNQSQVMLNLNGFAESIYIVKVQTDRGNKVFKILYQ